MRRLPPVLIFFCLLLPARLALALPDGLAGHWRGTLAQGGAELSASVIVLPAPSGFSLDLRLPGVPPIAAGMVPAGRPDVFQVPAESGGLFSFFERGGPRTPLDGAPLVWARATETGLVAYRLVIIADGATELVRVALEPAEDGLLAVTVERRRDGGVAEQWQATLGREG